MKVFVREKENFEFVWLEWGVIFLIKLIFSDFIVSIFKNMVDIMIWMNSYFVVFSDGMRSG